MFINLYTTKMSGNSKKLKNRFLKLRSKNGRISKIMAVAISVLLLATIGCSMIVMAALDESDKTIENGTVSPISEQTADSYSFVWPCDSHKISQHYGNVEKGGTFHKGVDIVAPEGANVYAATSGEVVFAGWDSNKERGQYIIIRDENVETVYNHLSDVEVKVGDIVTQKDVIGKVGQTGWATGPNLGFEVKFDGQHSNPEKLTYNVETVYNHLSDAEVKVGDITGPDLEFEVKYDGQHSNPEK